MPLVNLRSCAKVMALSLLGLATALDNGVGLTPAMGYNTWDDFRCGGINASNVRKVADAMVRSGLDRVGYRYLGLDDCWATSRNATTGAIVLTAGRAHASIHVGIRVEKSAHRICVSESTYVLAAA